MLAGLEGVNFGKKIYFAMTDTTDEKERGFFPPKIWINKLIAFQVWRRIPEQNDFERRPPKSLNPKQTKTKNPSQKNHVTSLPGLPDFALGRWLGSQRFW